MFPSPTHPTIKSGFATSAANSARPEYFDRLQFCAIALLGQPIFDLVSGLRWDEQTAVSATGRFSTSRGTYGTVSGNRLRWSALDWDDRGIDFGNATLVGQCRRTNPAQYRGIGSISLEFGDPQIWHTLYGAAENGFWGQTIGPNGYTVNSGRTLNADEHVIAYTWSNARQTVRYWEDGQQVAEQALAITYPDRSNTPVNVDLAGGTAQWGEGGTGWTGAFMFWDKNLSDAELADITNDPFIFVRRRVRAIFPMPASAGPDPVQGTITAEARTSGQLDISPPAAGTATAQGRCNGTFDINLSHVAEGQITSEARTQGTVGIEQLTVGLALSFGRTSGALVITQVLQPSPATSFARTMGTLTLPSIIVVDLINEPSDVGCATGTNQRILRDGWIDFDLTTIDRIVYCSFSNGSDLNGGTSPADAYSTINQALGDIRDGFADWIYLERGEIWPAETIEWTTSGPSHWNPQGIRSYGTGDRPKLDGGDISIRTNGVSHVAFLDLDFHNRAGDWNDPNYVGPTNNLDSFFCDQTAENVQFENCRTRFYSNWTMVEASVTKNNIFVNRCSFHNHYNDSGFSQGSFIEGLQNFMWLECVYFSNGWEQDRNAGGGLGAALFDHNLYIGNGAFGVPSPDSAVIKRCCFADASSHGIHGRTGGLFYDNLFVRNPISLQSGYTSDNNWPDGNSSYIMRNVVLEGSDIRTDDDSFHRGVGINPHHQIRCVMRGNIVAHNINAVTQWNAYSFQMGEQPASTNYELLFYGNIVYEWTNNAGNAGGPFDWNGVNIVTQDDVNGWYVPQYPPGATGTNYDSDGITWLDPDRSVASYNLAQSGAGTYDDFMQEMIDNERATWNPNYETTAVNDYIRTGFTAGTPTALGTTTALARTSGAVVFLLTTDGTATAEARVSGTFNIVEPGVVEGATTALARIGGQVWQVVQAVGLSVNLARTRNTLTIEPVLEPSTIESQARVSGLFNIDPPGVSGRVDALARTSGQFSFEAPAVGVATAQARASGAFTVTEPGEAGGTITARAQVTGLLTVNEPQQIGGSVEALARTAGAFSFIAISAGTVTALARARGFIPIGQFTPNPCRVAVLPDQKRTIDSTEC